MCGAAFYLKDDSIFSGFTPNVKCRNVSEIEKFVEKQTTALEFELFRKAFKPA